MMRMDDIWMPCLHKSIEMWNKKKSDVWGWRATNDVNFLLRMLFIEQMIYQSYAHKNDQAMYTIHSLMDEYAHKLNS